MNIKRAITASILIFLISMQATAMKRSFSEPVRSSSFETVALLVPAASAIIAYLRMPAEPTPERMTTHAPLNRGVFLVTNEVGSDANVEHMRALPARGNVGLGVSSLFNLELFVARFAQGVTHWVMIDPAPEVQHFWKSLQAAFKNAHDLDAVFAQLAAEMQANRGEFFTAAFLIRSGLSCIDDYKEWLTANLQEAHLRLKAAMQEMRFEKLKDLILNHLTLMPTDLASEKSVRQLGSYLCEHGHLIDTVYASNVYVCLPQDALKDFRDQIDFLRTLADDKTSYLLEALPKNDGELARLTAEYSIQKIYKN